MLKQYGDEDLATLHAVTAGRNNSVNFGNYGEYVQGMRILNPYLNAGVQGARGLAKAFNERPAATTAKVFTIIAAPAMATTYHNLSDPESAVFYANLPDYVKDNNFVWVIKNADGTMGAITIKMPPGISRMAKPFRNMVEAEFLGDRQSFAETAKNLFIDPFNPLGTDAKQMLGSVTPQGLKQGLELTLNKNLYTGQDIVPENLKGLPPSEQLYDSTGTLYKKIGGALGVSPLKVKNTIKGLTAGAGEQGVSTIDMVINKFDPNATVEQRNTVQQIVGRFYTTKANSGTSSMYTDIGKAQSLQKVRNKAITEAVVAGDYDKARSIGDKYQEEMKAALSSFEKKYRDKNGKWVLKPEDVDTYQSLVESLKINTTDKGFKARIKNANK
jgi:hypothetical protein